MTIRLGLVGLGTIARAQHLPSIAATEGIELVAIASRNARLDGVANYPNVGELLAAEPDVTAISLCTPPQGRFDQAVAVIRAGRHLMLEKPPGSSIAEVDSLARLAMAAGVTLFATWHSREAAGVEAARDFLAGTTLRSLHVSWREDVRRWHPGQQWIWEPGGLGVFDPGINALSIVTRILPEPMHLTAADLLYPANRAAPIAATLSARTASGVPITADLDWRQTGAQTWDITAETDAGRLVLSRGGARLSIDGHTRVTDPDREYQRLYRRFVDLVQSGSSDVDLAPLALVADAFLLGRRQETAPFEDDA